MPTLEQRRVALQSSTAAQIEVELATVDAEILRNYYDEAGEIRDLTTADHTELEGLISLRERCVHHLQIRQAFDRSGGRGTEMAFGAALVRTGHDMASDASEVLRLGGDQLRNQALRMLEARGGDLPGCRAGSGGSHHPHPAGAGES